MLNVVVFLVSLGVRAIRAMCRHRANLVLENVALRQQVTALKKERPRPPLDDTERAFWVALRGSWPVWASRLLIVHADTVARWHRDQRGLQVSTARCYRQYAEKFLSHGFDSKCVELGCLGADDITTFILHESKTSSVATTKLVVTALRSLLRFLHLRGDLQRELVGAVPGVAGWRQVGMVPADRRLIKFGARG